jgi:predicted TIM-barrel fold metal-dependent hydrolase
MKLIRHLWLLATIFTLQSAYGGELGTNSASFPTNQPQRIFDPHIHAFDPVDMRAAFGDDPRWGYQATNRADLPCRTVRAMRENNVQRALVHGDNDMVLDWVNQYPDLFIAAWTPDPGEKDFLKQNHAEKAREFAALVDQGKYRAIGELLHAYWYPLNDPSLWPYYAVAEEKGIPVLFHTGDTMHSEGTGVAFEEGNGIEAKFGTKMSRNANAALLGDLAARFPKLRILACHAGMENLEGLIKTMKTHPLIAADISNINWIPNDPRLIRALKRFREEGMMDRVCFGSDQCNYPELISRTIRNTKAVLTAEECRWVFYENAQRILGLK